MMDCQMPMMGGLEATRVIRDRETRAGESRRIPIIALTAHAMEGDTALCFEAGMDGYISKPYTLSELQQELERVLFPK